MTSLKELRRYLKNPDLPDDYLYEFIRRDWAEVEWLTTGGTTIRTTKPLVPISILAGEDPKIVQKRRNEATRRKESMEYEKGMGLGIGVPKEFGMSRDTICHVRLGPVNYQTGEVGIPKISKIVNFSDGTIMPPQEWRNKEHFAGFKKVLQRSNR